MRSMVSTRTLIAITCCIYIAIVLYCYHVFVNSQQDDVPPLYGGSGFRDGAVGGVGGKKPIERNPAFNWAQTHPPPPPPPPPPPQPLAVRENSTSARKAAMEIIPVAFHSIIANNLYVTSVYEDSRDPQRTYLRFLIFKSRATPQLWCVYSNDLTPTPSIHSVQPMTDLRGSAGKYYEMCENHNLPAGGFLGVCVTPAVMVGSGGSSSSSKWLVTLSSSSNPSMRMMTEAAPPLPVQAMRPLSVPAPYNIGLCIPTLFGAVNHKELFEFFLIIFELGIDHVTMYVDEASLSGDTQRVLTHFVNLGRLLKIPWQLPASVGTNWNYAQILNVNDCLYRSMSLYNYVAFHDIDEFIVPQGEFSTLNTMLQHQWQLQPKLCGICFKSAFFPPAEGVSSNSFRLHDSTQRTAVLSQVRTKCLVDPRRIYEMGIHHISKPFQEHFVNIKVDERVAILYHYRRCLGDFGMRCDQFVKDTTLQTVFQRAKVNEAWSQFQMSSGSS